MWPKTLLFWVRFDRHFKTEVTSWSDLEKRALLERPLEIRSYWSTITVLPNTQGQNAQITKEGSGSREISFVTEFLFFPPFFPVDIFCFNRMPQRGPRYIFFSVTNWFARHCSWHSRITSPLPEKQNDYTLVSLSANLYWRHWLDFSTLAYDLTHRSRGRIYELNAEVERAD